LLGCLEPSAPEDKKTMLDLLQQADDKLERTPSSGTFKFTQPGSSRSTNVKKSLLAAASKVRNYHRLKDFTHSVAMFRKAHYK